MKLGGSEWSVLRRVSLACVLLWILSGGSGDVLAGDCNDNGVPDEQDVASEISVPGMQHYPTWPEGRTDGRPRTLLAADLDADGDLDIAVANRWRSVALLLNSGQGTFEDRRWVEFGDSRLPISLLASDLDGDGLQDLAVVTVLDWMPAGEGTLHVLMGLPGGGFEEREQLTTASEPVDVATFDAEGDGDPDLAVAHGRAERVTVFENGGTGGFARIEDVSLPSAAVELFPADFDGNGTTDLLVGLKDPRRVIWLSNPENGSFVDVAAEEILSGPEAFTARVHDIDRDGLPDLVVNDLDEPGLSLYRNEGGGVLQFPGEQLSDEPIRDAALDDLDGDGRPDLLLVLSGLIGTAIQQDGGEFGDVERYYAGFDREGPIVSGDFDGDGAVDVAVLVGGDEPVSVIRNAGRGQLDAPLTEEFASPTEFFGLRGTDIDLDGDLDLVHVTKKTLGPSTWFVQIRRNLGGREFELAEETEIDTDPDDLEIFDADGDGYEDVVVAFGKVVACFLNQRDGSLGEASRVDPGGSMTELEVADFDLDGRLDLAVSVIFPVGIVVLLNAGEGRFRPSVTISWEQTTFSPPLFMVVDDFDGNEFPDILVAPHGDNPTRIYKNLGDARFGPPVPVPEFEFAWAAASMDVDRDGDEDVITPGRETIRIHPNRGDGTFGESFEIPFAPGFEQLIVEDFDRSGNADLLLFTTIDHEKDIDQGRLSILLDKGAERFGRRVDWITGYRPSGAVLADLDGDGALDIATTNRGGSIMRPSIAFQYGVLTPASSEDGNRNGVPDECESRPFHRGDANVDGRLDVSDGICILTYLFAGGAEPPCKEAADADGNGVFDCADPLFTLRHVFLGTEPPPEPGPPDDPCGLDTDLPGSSGFLGCDEYPPCS